MKDLLYLVHRIPYPPNKGDKIRSFNILKYLSSRYRVHLGAFVDAEDDWRYVDDVKSFCATTELLPLKPQLAKLLSLTGLVRGEALSLPYYRNAKMKAWVDRTIRDYKIKHSLVFSSTMAQYVENYNQLRRVADYVDIDSDKWRQYAEKKRWPMSSVYRRESDRLFAYEKKIASVFDQVLFVSQKEAQLFQQLAPDVAKKTSYFNNGVDVDYFSPQHDFPSPYPPSEQVLVFCGAMDYWANVDAVVWFAREVFPSVRSRYPNVRFYIVGSKPTVEVVELERIDGVKVTGAVKDVRPYVAHAHISVAPLRIARGIQNKILEAMAMAKSVVASPQGYEGIDANIGRDLVVVDTPQQWINALSEALSSPVGSRMGENARRFVLENFTWESSLDRLNDVL